MVRMVAKNVVAETLSGSGHFVPEEASDTVIRHVREMARRYPDRRRPMPHHSTTSTPAEMSIPADGPNLTLTVIDPDDPEARHISVIGDTYTILISGAQTDGRYWLIDMLVPDGSGPPPHRHDFEEMFSLLESELEFTVRGKTQTVKTPMSVNIPANAPQCSRTHPVRPSICCAGAHLPARRNFLWRSACRSSVATPKRQA
jgi:mannose-6-phosphate isomerase-like protein (cupin superfamily)